jgi:hypothetical protein
MNPAADRDAPCPVRYERVATHYQNQGCTGTINYVTSSLRNGGTT